MPAGTFGAAGQWAYWQVVRPDHHYVTAGLGEHLTVPHNGQWGLDNQLPYAGAYETGTFQLTDDTPHVTLNPNFSSISTAVDAVMYAMFKPPGDDSKWVAITAWEWGYYISATENNGAWVIGPANQWLFTPPQAVSLSSPPTWNFAHINASGMVAE